MPSIRKKYRGGNGSEPAAPVVETVSPVEAAAQTAIKTKLDEQDQTASALKEQLRALEKAESAQRLATEPPQQPRFPEAVEAWLTAHPEYLNDRVRNLELMLAHEKAVRDGVTALDAPEYLPAIERHLGLNTAPPVSEPTPEAPAPAPTLAPQAQYQGPPISAPISRDAPSMGGGRVSDGGIRLTPEEVVFARSQNLTPDEYLRQKVRLAALKRSGAVQ
jgi:hypothetical protein